MAKSVSFIPINTPQCSKDDYIKILTHPKDVVPFSSF
jgi:hypothetical protein